MIAAPATEGELGLGRGTAGRMISRIDRMSGKGPTGAIAEYRNDDDRSDDPPEHWRMLKGPHRPQYTAHRAPFLLRQIRADPLRAGCPGTCMGSRRTASFVRFDQAGNTRDLQLLLFRYRPIASRTSGAAREGLQEAMERALVLRVQGNAAPTRGVRGCLAREGTCPLVSAENSAVFALRQSNIPICRLVPPWGTVDSNHPGNSIELRGAAQHRAQDRVQRLLASANKEGLSWAEKSIAETLA